LWRWQSLYSGANETVASLRKCFDVAWFFGFVIQCLAKLLDCRIQAVVEIDEGIGGPKLLSKLFSGDDLSRVLEQYRQDTKRLLLEPDPVAAFAQFAGTQVQLVIVEPQGPFTLGCRLQVMRLVARNISSLTLPHPNPKAI
jgi:hypothetical protein